MELATPLYDFCPNSVRMRHHPKKKYTCFVEAFAHSISPILKEAESCTQMKGTFAGWLHLEEASLP